MSLRARPPNPDPELLVVEDAEFLEQLQLLEKHNGDSDLRELCVERVCCYALTGLNFMRMQCLLPKLSVIICIARAQGGLLLVLCSPATCDDATAQSMMSSGCVDLIVQQLRVQVSDDSLITSLKCARCLLAWPRSCDFFTQAGVISPLIHTITHHLGLHARILALEVLDILARDSDDVRELCCKWGAAHALLRCISQPEPSNDDFLTSAVKASASLALSKTARISFMRLGALLTMQSLVCQPRRLPHATWTAIADLVLRLANMGIACSQLVALLPPHVAEGSSPSCVSLSSATCSAAALALGDHVSRAWRRLMAEFNSMIKSSRPAQDVLGLNLKNLELKYSLVLVVIGRLLSRLRPIDRSDAFAHVRGHMGGEVAAELRQSVIQASLVAYGAVMPLVEKNMVLFNDLVALAFAEKVLQDDSALAAKWSIVTPPVFPHRISDERNDGGNHNIPNSSSSNSSSNTEPSVASPPPESHIFGKSQDSASDREAAVNRQVASAVSEIRCTVGEIFEEKAKDKGFVWLGRLAKRDAGKVTTRSTGSNSSISNNIAASSSEGTRLLGGSAPAGDQESLQPFTLETYDYDAFVKRMRSPEAQPLREQTRSFVNSILNRARVVLQSIKGEVSDFVWLMGQQLLQHPLWTGCSECDVMESLERYVCLRLHGRVFASDPSSRQNDALLHLRVCALNFITPAHLDIHPSRRCASNWMQAQAALRHMHDCITPREMLEDVLECAKYIYAPNPDECVAEPEPLSADEYLPILIYQVLQSGLPQLQSIIDYITVLRHPALMTSECQYFFTHFVGAVFFIESLDASQLSIDPAVFQQLMCLAEDSEVAGVRDRVPSTGLFSPVKLKAVAAASEEEDVKQQTKHQSASVLQSPSSNPNRRQARRDTLQPQDAQAMAAIAAAAVAEAAIPSIPEEEPENSDHGDDGSAGGGMMFKEIHEQILLLGSSTPQTVVPLLMGRSSSTAVMRSRYMSRDAGPSTQEQLEHNQDQKQEDGAVQEEGEHAAPLEQRKPAAASDGTQFKAAVVTRAVLKGAELLQWLRSCFSTINPN